MEPREVSIAYLELELEEKRDALERVRNIVAELYADRGEDDRVKQLCLEAMEVADRVL